MGDDVFLMLGLFFMVFARLDRDEHPVSFFIHLTSVVMTFATWVFLKLTAT